MEKQSNAVPAGLGHSLWRGWDAAMDKVWRSLFGSPDLGDVDFATLERRRTPNDALACSKEVCPKAPPDFEPPIFPLPAAHLRAIISEAALSEPDTTLVHSGEAQDRYLVRTRFMRFPDTVNAMVIPCGEAASTLALYSRSQIGRSDFGVNRRRLERWIERIGTLAAQESRRSSP